MRKYFRYVRGENGRGIGAIEIIADVDKFGIGLSLCNPLDIFNKDVAKDVANERAEAMFNGCPYSYFDIIDDIWYGEFLDAMPASKSRADDVDLMTDTAYQMIDDIVKDYGRYYIDNRATLEQIKTMIDNLK